MKLSLRTGEATQGARLRRALAALWAWRWGRPLGRALLVAGALVVLAAIGRSTLAGAAGQAPSVGDAGPARDPPPLVALPPALGVSPTAADTSAQPAPHGDPPATTPSAEAHRGPPTPEDPVFLNQATQDDLQRLPGIGPKRALSILALRTKMGRFRQVEDLTRVRGIGRATLKRLRPLVKLDPPLPADASTG